MPAVVPVDKARSSGRRRICKNAIRPYRCQAARQAKYQRTLPRGRGTTSPRYDHLASVPRQDRHRPAPAQASNLYNLPRTRPYHSAGHNHPAVNQSGYRVSGMTQHRKLAATSTIAALCPYSRRRFQHPDWPAQRTSPQHRLALAASDRGPARYIACGILQYRRPERTVPRHNQGRPWPFRPDRALPRRQFAYQPSRWPGKLYHRQSA